MPKYKFCDERGKIQKCRSNRIMGYILSVRQGKKQTNKQKTKQRPSKKRSNFQEAAGDIRVPVRNKERKMS